MRHRHPSKHLLLDKAKSQDENTQELCVHKMTQEGHSWLLSHWVSPAGAGPSVVHLTCRFTWRTSPSSSTWYLVASFTTLLSLCFASFSRSYKGWKTKKLSKHLGIQLRTHMGLAPACVQSIFTLWLCFHSTNIL